ncbi:MAG: Flp1 family type IVb pilin [Anaerocolumna sp.]
MNKIKDFIKEEEGIAVVEIVLILVLLIGLVVLFRDNIIKIVNDIMAKLTTQVGSFNTP